MWWRKRTPASADAVAGLVPPTRDAGPTGHDPADGDAFELQSSGEKKAPTMPGSVARVRAQLSKPSPTKTSLLRGPYVPLDFSADPIKGTALKLAAFLSGFSLTRKVLTGIAERQLQLEMLRELDLSDHSPLAEPNVGTAPPENTTPLKALASSTRENGPATITGLHTRYLSGETTPTEIVEKFLVAQRDDPTSSFVYIDVEQLRSDAAAATERYRAGASIGPLDGVPIAVKDQMDVEGLPTTVGTSFFGQIEFAKKDAAVVANVRKQGALIVGKTLMNELGFGVNGVNAKQGTVHNPHDLTRSAGGSSGGSAAAVATELVAAAIGSDAGGSTRLPASLNGLFGLKPTWSRLDGSGNYPLAPSTQQAGPIARTAQDAALLYAAMAGGAALHDFTSRDLSGIRVGVYRDFATHAAPEVVANLKQTIAKLQERGAEIVDVHVDDLNLVTHTQLINYACECFATQAHLIDRDPGYGADTKLNLQLARAMSGPLFTQAQRARAAISTAMQNMFEGVDVMLTPTSAITAPLLPKGAEHTGASDLEEAEALLRFTALPSVTGHPALTVPTGQDSEGLPIGMQLTGKFWQENTLLRIGNALDIDVPAAKTVAPVFT